MSEDNLIEELGFTFGDSFLEEASRTPVLSLSKPLSESPRELVIPDGINSLLNKRKRDDDKILDKFSPRTIDEIKLRAEYIVCKNFRDVCKKYKFNESEELVDFDNLIEGLSLSNWVPGQITLSTNSNSNPNSNSNSNSNSKSSPVKIGGSAMNQAFLNASEEFKNSTRPIDLAVPYSGSSSASASASAFAPGSTLKIKLAPASCCSRNILDDLNQRDHQKLIQMNWLKIKN